MGLGRWVVEPGQATALLALLSDQCQHAAGGKGQRARTGHHREHREAAWGHVRVHVGRETGQHILGMDSLQSASNNAACRYSWHLFSWALGSISWTSITSASMAA